MQTSFIPKTGGALLIGGAFGGGGVFLYHEATPKDWKEGLVRAGASFISSLSEDDGQQSNAYRAVYIDNQDSIKEDIDDSITDENTAISKTKKWCEAELKKAYSLIDNSTKEKILKYCQDKQPKTVESVLKRGGIGDWIKDSSDENKDGSYKIIFVVYRYSSDFLNAINSVRSSDERDYDENTEASKGYLRLKSWCENSLSKSSEESISNAFYSQVIWWCKALSYKTIEERIKHEYKDWKKEDSVDTSSDGLWNKIKEYWQRTSEVFTLMDPSKSNEANGSSVEPYKYKEWCDKTLGKKLDVEDAYQKEYLIAKSVCAKEAIQKTLGTTNSMEESIKKSQGNRKPRR